MQQTEFTHNLQGIVIFDGDCGICTAVAEWMESQDRDHRLLIKPYQFVDLPAVHPELNKATASKAVQFVLGDKRHAGARAMFEALRRLPGLWGVIGAVWALPPLALLAEPFYRVFAANRTRISVWTGKTACAVPQPDTEHKA